MIREMRYTVLKHKDMEKYLSEVELQQLCAIDSKINFCRQQEGRRLLTAAVVENDWPEYEAVWEMIERRVDGNGLCVPEPPPSADITS